MQIEYHRKNYFHFKENGLVIEGDVSPDLTLRYAELI